MQPKPRLGNSAPRLRAAEFMGFAQRRLALGLWRVLAQVLFRSFRPVFLTHRQATAPRFLRLHLVSTPPSRSQNTAPVSSAASLRSTTPWSPRRSRFTVDLTLSRLLVVWRSSTLVPHRPSSVEVGPRFQLPRYPAGIPGRVLYPFDGLGPSLKHAGFRSLRVLASSRTGYPDIRGFSGTRG